MKPFKLDRKTKAALNTKERRQNKLVRSTVARMEDVMRKAIDSIIDGRIDDKFVEPSLNEMFEVSRNFYHSVCETAWHTSDIERRAMKPTKRLASINNPKIPSLKDLESLFRNSKVWPSMMKRSDKLTARLKKAYMQKLRRKFKDILPQLLSGEITSEIAKKRMMGAWGASKSRVETIFRTETTKYFGEIQVSYFKDEPEILGFLFDSIADRSRTNICRSRHGLIFKSDSTGPKGLAYNTPALHWNCRSHLIALANTPENRKMLEDPARDPNRKKLEPLPPGWRK